MVQGLNLVPHDEIFDFVRAHMQIGQGVTPTDSDILGDPQTSGGLLLAIPEEKVDELVRKAT